MWYIMKIIPNSGNKFQTIPLTVQLPLISLKKFMRGGGRFMKTIKKKLLQEIAIELLYPIRQPFSIFSASCPNRNPNFSKNSLPKVASMSKRPSDKLPDGNKRSNGSTRPSAKKPRWFRCFSPAMMPSETHFPIWPKKTNCSK